MDLVEHDPRVVDPFDTSKVNRFLHGNLRWRLLDRQHKYTHFTKKLDMRQEKSHNQIFMHNHLYRISERDESPWNPLYTAPAKQNHKGDKAE